MRHIVLLILLCAVFASGWELTLEATCISCGFYQDDIVLTPGISMAPCPVCGIIVTKLVNRTIGSGECKNCHTPLLCYPQILMDYKWWQGEKAGEQRRNTASIYECPVCGGASLRFVCVKRKD